MPDGPPHWLRSQLRHMAMILVFDLGGPLLVYTVLRSAGMSTVVALILSGIPPALGIVIGAVADRRLDVIGVLVLAGLAVGRWPAWSATTPGSTWWRAQSPRWCSPWPA